ncbi:hypothetical protein HPP92_004374 [Vanilla planifolia]|uniref:RRM domain-containing protein n=1 Tax=Vanilla planifolia TaxID=51239 RepID=A0A835RS47_VANPL|nr:hypothetical protein HPP92_004374 [Vanilla planifolia]
MAQVNVPTETSSAGTSGAAATVAIPGAASSANTHTSTSLYVGDLNDSVTDAQLFDVFSQVGHVISVHVCLDVNTGRSLGYAYVNFSNPGDAASALEMLNFTPLNGKPMRIMYSNRDPSLRKSGTANIFIKNLDKAIDHKALHDTFSAFGHVISCKLATDLSGQSKGYGFVQFEKEEEAQNAIEKLNGMCLNDKAVYVGPFLRKQERENTVNKTKFNNVFVKNFSESTTEDVLTEVFGEFGKITSAVVMRDKDGKSKCFGFVNFENPNDAVRAIEELNGKEIDEKEWYVQKAQKKSERELELKEGFDQNKNNKAMVYKRHGLNLYLKNLDFSIDDERLKELFSEFGTITSCKVMRDQDGASRGSGFVAFSTAGEASQALTEMNGKLIGSKHLYVALAQSKEERRAQLQAQFAQIRPVVTPAPAAPRMPIFPHGLRQQLFYGQGPPAFVPPQAGFVFEQFAANMGPGGAPLPNFFVPLQGQRPQRPGHRLGGIGTGQPLQPIPMTFGQMLPRGLPSHYPSMRNGHYGPTSNFVGGMPSLARLRACLSQTCLRHFHFLQVH